MDGWVSSVWIKGCLIYPGGKAHIEIELMIYNLDAEDGRKFGCLCPCLFLCTVALGSLFKGELKDGIRK